MFSQRHVRMSTLFDRAYGIAIIACEASSETEVCQQAIAGSLATGLNLAASSPRWRAYAASDTNIQKRFQTRPTTAITKGY